MLFRSNFDYGSQEIVTVQVKRNGKTEALTLTEESANSAWFSAELPKGSQAVSYGYGYFEKTIPL